MNSVRLIVHGLDCIEGLNPINCDSVVGVRGLEFSVQGTQQALREAASQLIGGTIAATVNGDLVTVVASVVAEVHAIGTHQINVVASYQKFVPRSAATQVSKSS